MHGRLCVDVTFFFFAFEVEHIRVNACVRVHMSVHVSSVFVNLKYTILRLTCFLHCVLSGCKETGLGTDSLSFHHKPFSFKDFSL